MPRASSRSSTRAVFNSSLASVEACDRRRVRVRSKPGAGEPKRQGDRHQSLLCSVVEVALEAAPFGDRGLDDPCS